MALSKQVVLAKIEVLEDGVIQVQRATRVVDDVEGIMGERFHREAFPPTTDPATLPARVRQIATVVWTPTVIDAYKAAHPARTP